jgi:Flp pilus assembly protein TadD
MNLGFACLEVGDRACAESEYRELLRFDVSRAEALGDALRRHPSARTGQ